MTEGLNRVMLLGNLGADVECRSTPGGQTVARLRIATTESYLDRNRVKQERTDWHVCVVWGKRAEALSRILSKGDRIFVEGRIQTSSYEKDGEKRYKTEIVASNVILSGGSRRGQSEQDAAPSSGSGGTERDDDFDDSRGSDFPF